MKFMQSDVKYQKESEENYSKNIKDDSEWISPYYHQYLTKVKPKNVEYIGYANINDIESNDIQNSETGHGFRNGNPGRKVWGDNTIDEKAILDISKLKDTIFKNNKVSIYSFFIYEYKVNFSNTFRMNPGETMPIRATTHHKKLPQKLRPIRVMIM